MTPLEGEPLGYWLLFRVRDGVAAVGHLQPLTRSQTPAAFKLVAAPLFYLPSTLPLVSPFKQGMLLKMALVAVVEVHLMAYGFLAPGVL